MNSRPIRLAVFPVLVCLLAVTFSGVSQTQPPHDDAGLNRDAPNARTDAGNAPLEPNHRYTGRIDTDNDQNDWYSFDIDTIDGTKGRPVVDLVLAGVPSATLHLELYDPDGNEASQGTGTSGIRSLTHSLGGDGRWAIHVGRVPPSNPAAQTGGGGEYELTFILRYEDDAGKGRDAGDGSNSARIDLGSISLDHVVNGELNPGDEVDEYTFTPTDPSGQILAALHFPVGADVSVEAISQSGTAFGSPQERSGESFMTSLKFGGGTGSWFVRVTNNDPAFGTPYVLTFRQVPSGNDGDGSASDAPASFSSATAIGPGLYTGRLNPPSDAEDRYKFEVGVGDIIAFGASSYRPDASTDRAFIELTLYRPISGGAPIEYKKFTICGGAHGIYYEAPAAGTWYAGIRAATGCPPTDLGSISGYYAISLDVLDHDDADGADAPEQIGSGAPQMPDDALHIGWTDEIDRADVYALGVLQAGTVVRAAFTTNQMDLQTNIDLIDNSNNIVASSNAEEGRGRLHKSVGETRAYFIRIEQTPTDEQPVRAGFYMMYAMDLGNLAPLAVNLGSINRPIVPCCGDVETNSVDLGWSQSPDDDFDRYEVHVSEESGFTPSDATLYETFTDRTETSTTVRELHPGHTYQFMIRVYDDAGSFSDSNRRTTTTRFDTDNDAPTLSDGKVSPTQGNTTTLFQFSVTYGDSDNDSAVERHVFINGEPHVMDGHSKDWEGGVKFTLNTTLRAGEHSFFFRFSDGDKSARDPEEDSFTGPLVTQSGNNPPRVEASATPRSGDAPLTVKFNAQATDADNEALNYTWDFDNSNGIQADSHQTSPTFTYTSRGLYTATVRVRDARNVTSTDSVTINVAGDDNTQPTARATATPVEGKAPLVVKFNAGASDPDGTISSYSWDFDNSNGLQREASEASPSHTYTRGGTFVATVTVTDNQGAKATSSVVVAVRTDNNAPPRVVVLATPREGAAPLDVEFSANATDPDGGPLEITWDFDLHAGFSEDATGETVTHTYTDGGTFTAMAVVRDGSGATATGIAEITVTGGVGGNASAQSGLVILAEPSEGKAPLSVQFDVDESDLGVNLVSYRWDFGDGSELATERSPNHTFQRGTHIVTLTATDDNDTDYQGTIVIRSQGPDRRGTPGLELPALLVAVAVAGLLAVRRRQGPK